MTEAFPRPSRTVSAAAILLGGYAAAIALAPGPRALAALTAPPALALLLWWTLLKPARWIALFFFSSLLLPPFPVAAGDSGPHAALLFAAAGVAAGALRLGDWQVQAAALPASLVLFAGVLFGSASLAAIYSGAAIAAGTLIRALLFAVSAYVFVYTAYGPGRPAPEDARRAVRWLFCAASASAVFACLDFYFQFPAPAGYGPQFVWLASGVFRRAQGVFYESSTLGNFCAFFLAMIAAALFRPRAASPLSRAALLAGGAVISAALIFSYSRASLLNVAASLAALLYLNRGRLRAARLLAGAAFVAAAGALIVYGLFPSFAEAYWTRLWNSGQYLSSSANGVLSGRLDSWIVLGDFLARRPWHALFGIGYKTLPYSDFAGRPVIADNMYLSLLVETGVVGLLAFLALNAAILRAALKAARAADETASFFGAWIFCFWAGEMVQMLSGDLFTYWRVLPLYFWTLAVAVALERRARPASA